MGCLFVVFKVKYLWDEDSVRILCVWWIVYLFRFVILEKGFDLFGVVVRVGLVVLVEGFLFLCLDSSCVIGFFFFV